MDAGLAGRFGVVRRVSHRGRIGTDNIHFIQDDFEYVRRRLGSFNVAGSGRLVDQAADARDFEILFELIFYR